jgi:hypothetical protein
MRAANKLGRDFIGCDKAYSAPLLLQHGCSVDTLHRSLTRNSDGSASGPLACALDLFASEQ